MRNMKTKTNKTRTQTRKPYCVYLWIDGDIYVYGPFDRRTANRLSQKAGKAFGDQCEVQAIPMQSAKDLEYSAKNFAGDENPE